MMANLLEYQLDGVDFTYQNLPGKAAAKAREILFVGSSGFAPDNSSESLEKAVSAVASMRRSVCCESAI
jgi:hypothetical protein